MQEKKNLETYNYEMAFLDINQIEKIIEDSFKMFDQIQLQKILTEYKKGKRQLRNLFYYYLERRSNYKDPSNYYLTLVKFENTLKNEPINHLICQNNISEEIFWHSLFDNKDNEANLMEKYISHRVSLK